MPIALLQVKAGNTSENVLNETEQIQCAFYWAKQITEKVLSS